MDETGALFTLGAKVRLTGLKTQADLNGAIGILVSQKDENRWQVLLENDLGNKILKTKNLILEDLQEAAYAAEVGQLAPGEPEWFEVMNSIVFVKQAPSKDAKGLGLVRQGQRIQVRPARVKDADGGPSKWVELTPTQLGRLPECTGSTESSGYVLIDGTHLGLGTLLRGPLSWDECPQENEFPVVWGAAKEAPAAAAKPVVSGIWETADAAPEKSSSHGNSTAAAPAPHKEPQKQQPQVTIPQDLQEDVEWFEVAKSMVFIKEHPNKDSKNSGYVTGNEQLQVYRQRVYDAENRMWVELTALQLWRLPHCNENSGRGFALIDGTSIGVGKLLNGPLPRYEWPELNLADIGDREVHLKEHSFKVTGSDGWVYEAPTVDSPKMLKLRQGSPIKVIEETFDGWAKVSSGVVADEAGWVRRCKHDHEKSCVFTYLKNLEDTPPLLATMEIVKPGPKRFRVAVRPRVPVRVAPDRKARLRSAKEFGEFVWAESQTYDGWVRLKDGEGWILGYSLEDGPFLHAMLFEEVADWCKACRTTQQISSRGIGYEEDRVNAEIRSTKQKLTEILSSENPEEVRTALYRAKAWGINSDETWAAELRLDELRRFGYVELDGESTTKRVDRDTEPHASTDNSKVAGEPSNVAVIVTKSPDTGAVEAALAQLVAATQTGDAVAIREATKLAKAAGVPKKDIARAHALHC